MGDRVVSDKGFAASFVACLSATGVGWWSAEAWAAVISSCTSIGVLVIFWAYKHKEFKLKKIAYERDEHERGLPQ